MGYEYQVSSIDGNGLQSSDEEKLVGAGADMGRRESVQSGVARGKEEQAADTVSRPLAVATQMEAANIRPHRPWSEMPRK